MLPEEIKEPLEAYLGLSPEVFHVHHLDYVWKRSMAEHASVQDAVFTHFLLSNTEVLRRLGDEIYTPASWFFRSHEAFCYLQDWVRKKWLPKAKTGEPLKILSYPCAAGEEVHSLTMCLLEAGLKPEQFSIVGFDTRKFVLKQIPEGRYESNSMQEERVREYAHHFSVFGPEEYVVKPEVRSLAEFVHYNPIEHHEAFKRYAPFDVIFCRNLLIYLTPEYRQQLIAHLRANLKEGGYLFAGSSDNLPAIDPRFKFAGAKGSHAYRFDSDAKLEVPVAFEVPEEALPEGDLDEVQYSRQDTLENARELSESGFHEEAEYICHEHLAKTGPSAEIFFLLGRIYDAMGQTERSEEAFRKCVYIENGHPESYDALAQMAEKRGHSQHAEALRQRGTRPPFPKKAKS